jgi:PhnB protein
MQHRAVADSKRRSEGAVASWRCIARLIRASIRHPMEEDPMPSVKPIPDGYHSLAPYLIVADGAGAIAFYQEAFGAKLRLRLDRPDGKIGHAELDIGDGVIMLADEYGGYEAWAPPHFGGSPVTRHLYVEDVDAVVAKAIAAGARLLRPVQDQFYGDRSGAFTDPFGHSWHVATHIEDVPPDEIKRRAAAAMQQGQGA